ncbi:hypothetical protein [Bacillus massiliglaciei]|uniref:hypothetical protein n=1 Tax=Bacillus massiliglaciei TaxID=1816693 RepID=UPI0018FE42C3|nr:hypothetical protein [Bacillus massiliglaciei]
MNRNEKDYEAENMTDLVEFINCNNNSRKMNKILKKHKNEKEQRKSANQTDAQKPE